MTYFDEDAGFSELSNFLKPNKPHRIKNDSNLNADKMKNKNQKIKKNDKFNIAPLSANEFLNKVKELKKLSTKIDVRDGLESKEVIKSTDAEVFNNSDSSKSIKTIVSQFLSNDINSILTNTLKNYNNTQANTNYNAKTKINRNISPSKSMFSKSMKSSTSIYSSIVDEDEDDIEYKNEFKNLSTEQIILLLDKRCHSIDIDLELSKLKLNKIKNTISSNYNNETLQLIDLKNKLHKLQNEYQAEIK
jgi:hypothetical protein